MTTNLAQTIISPWITPVLVVVTSNATGTYYNGPNNNGVDATLTYALSSVTIDGVLLKVGDRVLFQAQTLANQNGIYIVKTIDTINTLFVFQRAADQQSLEQYKIGQYVSVGAGTSNAGKLYTLVSPLPGILGVGDLDWAAVGSSGGGAISGLTALYFGGSTSNTFVAAGLTTGYRVVATNYLTSNNQPVTSAICSVNGSLTITWAADPGATLVSWIAVPL